MFANLVMFGILALVCAVVSSEVYAALKAVEYARKQSGLTLVRKASVAWARYQWASFLWHELFCDDIGKAPAYRVSTPLAIWAGMMAAHVGAFYGFGIEVAPWQMMGSSLATAAGFFVAAYGRGFLAAREDVARQVEQGTWQLA